MARAAHKGAQRGLVGRSDHARLERLAYGWVVAQQAEGGLTGGAMRGGQASEVIARLHEARVRAAWQARLHAEATKARGVVGLNQLGEEAREGGLAALLLLGGAQAAVARLVLRLNVAQRHVRVHVARLFGEKRRKGGGVLVAAVLVRAQVFEHRLCARAGNEGL